MKRILLSLGVFIASTMFVQSQTLLSEDFESGSLPTGWSLDQVTGSDGWLVGTAAGMSSQYWTIPSTNATQIAASNDDACDCDMSMDRLITPNVDLTSASNATLTFDAFFNQEYGSIASVDVSTDGGTTWTNEFDLTADAAWQSVSVDLSGYAGQNILVAFHHDDGGAWADGFAVDNVQILVPVSLDLAATAITMNSIYGMNQAPIAVTGEVTNYGSSTITSMDINYEINNGTAVTQSLTGLSIAPLSSYTFSHNQLWTPAGTGTFNVKIYATNLNGSSDQNTANDATNMDVQIVQATTARLPLYEHFTSNTCGPCASFNPGFQTLLNNNNVNDPYGNAQVAAIKYQMDWPGAADQSYNADGQTRQQYYGVSGIPDPYFQGASASASQSEIDNALANPAFVDITATAQATGSQLDVSVTLDPVADINSNNLTLHIAVTENWYDNTLGTNGETEFFQVMRKMLPDGNGTAVSPLTAGNSASFNESYTFTVGNVTANSYNLWKGLYNVTVVVFLQDSQTKEIYNAALAYVANGVEEVEDNELEAQVYPNPFTESTNIKVNLSENEDVIVDVVNVLGERVFSKNYGKLGAGEQIIPFNADISAGMYYINIRSGNKTVTKKVTVK